MAHVFVDAVRDKRVAVHLPELHQMVEVRICRNYRQFPKHFAGDASQRAEDERPEALLERRIEVYFDDEFDPARGRSYYVGCRMCQHKRVSVQGPRVRPRYRQILREVEE